MKTQDLVKFSLRMFRARRGRTALTILGMGIGISAILFMVGLGYGLQNILLKAITTSDSLLALDIAPAGESNGIETGALEGMRGIDGVAEIVPVRDLKAQLKFQGIVTDATAVVTTPNLLGLEGKKIIAGSGNFNNSSKKIVVSSSFSQIFNISPEELIGKSVNFTLVLPDRREDIGAAYEIAGIVEADDLTFWVDEGNLGELVGSLPFSRLKVKSRSGEVLDGIKNKLQEGGFTVSSLSDTVKEVNKMFAGVKVVLALFGMVALLVSAIGMFNTMTVALLERTREIGIMKAIGASEKNIMMMFVIESATMGFLGGVSGVILGTVFGGAVNLIVNFVAWRLGGQTLALFSFPLWFILLILGFSLFIGFLTGVVPARRASVIDPLEALSSK